MTNQQSIGAVGKGIERGGTTKNERVSVAAMSCVFGGPESDKFIAESPHPGSWSGQTPFWPTACGVSVTHDSQDTDVRQGSFRNNLLLWMCKSRGLLIFLPPRDLRNLLLSHGYPWGGREEAKTLILLTT